MKRKAFTLAELLIALAIIGIIAAIVAPQLGKLIPDKNKVRVLKVYDVLQNITADMVQDIGLYFPKSGCTGLSCTEQPMKEPYNNAQYSGNKKFAALLASQLHLNGDSTINDAESTFETVDGIYWTVSGSCPYEVKIDVDGLSNGKNCTIDSCKKPDTFIFLVDASGSVTGGDSLTMTYIRNADNVNNKEEDIKGAGS